MLHMLIVASVLDCWPSSCGRNLPITNLLFLGFYASFYHHLVELFGGFTTDAMCEPEGLDVGARLKHRKEEPNALVFDLVHAEVNLSKQK